MIIEDKPNLIDIIDFKDIKVHVFYDKALENTSTINMCWQARNPDSFYTGIAYVSESGITYPEGAIIPQQTEKDKEMLPKFIIIGKKIIDNDMLCIIKAQLEKNYNIRNNKNSEIK